MKLTDEWAYDAKRQREHYELLVQFKRGGIEMRDVLNAVDRLVTDAYNAGKLEAKP